MWRTFLPIYIFNSLRALYYRVLNMTFLPLLIILNITIRYLTTAITVQNNSTSFVLILSFLKNIRFRSSAILCFMLRSRSKSLFALTLTIINSFKYWCTIVLWLTDELQLNYMAVILLLTRMLWHLFCISGLWYNSTRICAIIC